MTRDGYSSFIGFQNFPGEDPQPPFKIRKHMYVSDTAQHKPLVQSEVFKVGSKQQQLFFY